MFKNWIYTYKRNRFLRVEISKLIVAKIENFTTTEATDAINNCCTFDYSRLEVIHELNRQGFRQGFSLNKFEWMLPVKITALFVDEIILLSMSAFVGFALYLVIIQLF